MITYANIADQGTDVTVQQVKTVTDHGEAWQISTRGKEGPTREQKPNFQLEGEQESIISTQQKEMIPSSRKDKLQHKSFNQ